MNRHPAFQDVVACCTLLGMHGIAPSLLYFQQQLQRHIARYCHHLTRQGAPDNDILALQRLMCCVVDNLASRSFAAQGVSWLNHQLGHHFFGYRNGELFNSTHSVLLRNTTCSEIKEAARIMFALAPLTLPGSENMPLIAAPAEPELPDEVEVICPSDCLDSAAPGRTIHWLPLVCQIVFSSLLLGTLWYGFHAFLMRAL